MIIDFLLYYNLPRGNALNTSDTLLKFFSVARL